MQSIDPGVVVTRKLGTNRSRSKIEAGAKRLVAGQLLVAQRVESAASEAVRRPDETAQRCGCAVLAGRRQQWRHFGIVASRHRLWQHGSRFPTPSLARLDGTSGELSFSYLFFHWHRAPAFVGPLPSPPKAHKRSTPVEKERAFGHPAGLRLQYRTSTSVSTPSAAAMVQSAERAWEKKKKKRPCSQDGVLARVWIRALRHSLVRSLAHIHTYPAQTCSDADKRIDFVSICPLHGARFHVALLWPRCHEFTVTNIHTSDRLGLTRIAVPLGISAAEPECDSWPLAHHNLVHAATGPASSCILRFRFGAWPRPLAFPSVATAAVLGRPCQAPSRRLQSSRPAPLVLVGLLTVQLLHRPASPRLASLCPLLIGEAGACPEPLRVEPQLRSWCAPFRCSRWLAQVRRQRPQLQRQVGLLRPCIRAHYLNLQLRSQLKRKKCTAGLRRCCRSASRNQPTLSPTNRPASSSPRCVFQAPSVEDVAHA